MSRRGALLFAAMCVIWGIPYLLIKVAVEDLSPSVLVLLRTGIAALLLVPIAAAKGQLRPLLPYSAPVLAFAAIEIGAPWVLLGAAEQRISSSLAGLLIAAVPLVGTLIVLMTGGKERLGPQGWFGIFLGMAGVAAIVGVNIEGAGLVPLAQMALVAICYAVGPLILQRWLSDLPALAVIAASLAVVAVAYVPIAAFSLPEEMPSAEASASVLTLAVLCTAIAFLLFFALIAEIGPVRATVITYVNPAVAAVLGVAVLGEQLTAGMLVGFALVLAGSALATRPPQAAAAPAEPRAARL